MPGPKCTLSHQNKGLNQKNRSSDKERDEEHLKGGSKDKSRIRALHQV